MVCLIDNGHGIDTKGKRSPDGRLLEYEWTRKIAELLKKELDSIGVESILIVPEQKDVPLSERVKRVNNYCAQYGTQKCLLVSIHVNAAGSGAQWCTASGWSVFVAPNSSTKSKTLARILYEESEKLGLKGNRSVPTSKYWVGNFAIIRETKCPAVLTENLFQDNKNEVSYLLSEQGMNTIIQLHRDGIEKYIKEIQ